MNIECKELKDLDTVFEQYILLLITGWQEKHQEVMKDREIARALEKKIWTM